MGTFLSPDETWAWWKLSLGQAAVMLGQPGDGGASNEPAQVSGQAAVMLGQSGSDFLWVRNNVNRRRKSANIPRYHPKRGYEIVHAYDRLNYSGWSRHLPIFPPRLGAWQGCHNCLWLQDMEENKCSIFLSFTLFVNCNRTCFISWLIWSDHFYNRVSLNQWIYSKCLCNDLI